MSCRRPCMRRLQLPRRRFSSGIGPGLLPRIGRTLLSCTGAHFGQEAAQCCSFTLMFGDDVIAESSPRSLPNSLCPTPARMPATATCASSLVPQELMLLPDLATASAPLRS